MADEPDKDLPQPGERIGDRYEVLRLLGSGGMGVVVAARHLQLGHQVAIKMLQRASMREGEAVGRFLREGRASAALTSIHAVRVLDSGQTSDGAPYLVMEYLQGQDLSERLAARGPLPLGEVARMLLQACEALGEAHKLGIVHRDLKPSNLFLVEREGQAPLVKVLDFGISKFIESEEFSQSLTGTRSTLGTPLYMSPEQVRNAKRVDHRSDIWSIGVMLHELLCGQTPFEATSFSGLCAAIIADEPTPLRSAWPAAPDEIVELVSRCLQKDPAKRPASVWEVAEKLLPFADAEHPSAPRILLRSTGNHQASTLGPPISAVIPSTERAPSAEPPPPSMQAPPSAQSAQASSVSVSRPSEPYLSEGVRTLNGVASSRSEPPKRKGLAWLGVGLGVGVAAVAGALALWPRAPEKSAGASGAEASSRAAVVGAQPAVSAAEASGAASGAGAPGVASAAVPSASASAVAPAASAVASVAASAGVAPAGVAVPGAKAGGKPVTKPVTKGYSPTNDDRK